MGRFIYNISKFIFTTLFICVLFLLISGTTSVGYVCSICLGMVFSYFICFGQSFIGYEYSSGRNWYEHVIDFLTKIPIKYYKYKIDKIKYGDDSYRYYPRVRISLLGPLYYIYKNSYYSYKTTISKRATKYYKTKEGALYAIKEYKTQCINNRDKIKRTKNKNRITSKESINVSFNDD